MKVSSKIPRVLQNKLMFLNGDLYCPLLDIIVIGTKFCEAKSKNRFHRNYDKLEPDLIVESF